MMVLYFGGVSLAFAAVVVAVMWVIARLLNIKRFDLRLPAYLLFVTAVILASIGFLSDTDGHLGFLNLFIPLIFAGVIATIGAILFVIGLSNARAGSEGEPE